MIEVRPFDPHSASRAQWDRVHSFRRARGEEDFPSEPVSTDAEFERELRQNWPEYENRRWFAWAGEE